MIDKLQKHIINDNNLTKDITQEMLRVNLMNYFSEYFNYEIPTDKQKDLVLQLQKEGL